jgi:nucleoside-diphosphate-sugar epimerase
LVGQELIWQLKLKGHASSSIAVLSRSADRSVGDVRVIVGHHAALATNAAFRQELKSFDAVVHLADGLSLLEDRQFAGDAGALIDASRRFVRAVRDSGTKLFVYLSSIKAIANEEDDRVLVETSEAKSATVYGRAKLRLEEIVADTLHRSETQDIIVRSPVTYGRGTYGSLRRLLTLARTPWPLPLGGLNNRRSLLSIKNLASALAALLNAKDPPRGVFHLQDGPPLSTTEIVRTFRKAMGANERLVAVRPNLVRLLRTAPVTGPVARRLYGSLEVCDDRFRQRFDWTPVEASIAALTDMAMTSQLEPRPLQQATTEDGELGDRSLQLAHLASHSEMDI